MIWNSVSASTRMMSDWPSSNTCEIRAMSTRSFSSLTSSDMNTTRILVLCSSLIPEFSKRVEYKLTLSSEQRFLGYCEGLGTFPRMKSMISCV